MRVNPEVRPRDKCVGFRRASLVEWFAPALAGWCRMNSFRSHSDVGFMAVWWVVGAALVRADQEFWVRMLIPDSPLSAFIHCCWLSSVITFAAPRRHE